MKERPILFSAPMVLALLAGTKTQTRRIIKPVQPGDDGLWPGGRKPLDEPRYGQPGSQLWVRETWAPAEGPNAYLAPHGAVYRAGREFCVEPTWRPSIYMPRKASRITLEVTGVRVERVQEISESDAAEEGSPRVSGNSALDWYRALWASINGVDSWALNPWVWVVCFRRLQ